MGFRNLQTFLFFLLLMLLGLSAPLSAAEGKRLALVVGNSAYTATTPLANAAADARAFAAFLKENGFEVDSLINVDRWPRDAAERREFSARARCRAAVGV
ncbi:MAG: caspase family protein [Mesorhizobium sp.]|nr:MAG: caspase family protein [Mesorhizobium sp.]TIM65657.1 MAG: caspase family protein [Mesorhizobium sp.]